MIYNDEVKNDMIFEKWCQSEIVVPQWYSKIWPGCSIEEIDKLSHPLAKMLDVTSGIDKIIRTKTCLMGLSQRIQRKACANWNSITVRQTRHYRNGSESKSEFYKAIEAMEKGGLMAAYQSHIYMDGNTIGDCSKILDAIIVNRVAFFKWITNGQKIKSHSTKNKYGTYQNFAYFYFGEIPKQIVFARYSELPKPKLDRQLTFF